MERRDLLIRHFAEQLYQLVVIRAAQAHAEASLGVPSGGIDVARQPTQPDVRGRRHVLSTATLHQQNTASAAGILRRWIGTVELGLLYQPRTENAIEAEDVIGKHHLDAVEIDGIGGSSAAAHKELPVQIARSTDSRQ